MIRTSEIVGQSCGEMHCRSYRKEHNYGSPDCDFRLLLYIDDVNRETWTELMEKTK